MLHWNNILNIPYLLMNSFHLSPIVNSSLIFALSEITPAISNKYAHIILCCNLSWNVAMNHVVLDWYVMSFLWCCTLILLRQIWTWKNVWKSCVCLYILNLDYFDWLLNRCDSLRTAVQQITFFVDHHLIQIDDHWCLICWIFFYHFPS